MIHITPSTMVSKFVIHPKNWDTKAASIDTKWYIYYRFTDEILGKSKQVLIKGMNKYRDRRTRQRVTKELLKMEEELLFQKYYNPITQKFGITSEFDIDPSTPFIEAFKRSLTYMEKSQEEIYQTRCAVLRMEKYAAKLGFDNLPVSEISTRHLKRILVNIRESRPTFGARYYNRYVNFLIAIFKVLIELETVDVNPARDLMKLKEVKKLKQVLTTEQRNKINEYFKEVNPAYLRFIHIFFHSGARIRELLRLKVEDVSLSKQEFIITIKKGKSGREDKKAIKDIALPYWKEHIRGMPEHYYVFSEDFAPGPRVLRAERPTKYWRENVKKKLKINVDLYSLKHLNTTEISDMYSQEVAAAINSHTSTAMVRSIYDVNAKSRELEKLKKIGNSFA